MCQRTVPERFPGACGPETSQSPCCACPAPIVAPSAADVFQRMAEKGAAVAADTALAPYDVATLERRAREAFERVSSDAKQRDRTVVALVEKRDIVMFGALSEEPVYEGRYNPSTPSATTFVLRGSKTARRIAYLRSQGIIARAWVEADMSKANVHAELLCGDAPRDSFAPGIVLRLVSPTSDRVSSQASQAHTRTLGDEWILALRANAPTLDEWSDVARRANEALDAGDRRPVRVYECQGLPLRCTAKTAGFGCEWCRIPGSFLVVPGGRVIGLDLAPPQLSEQERKIDCVGHVPLQVKMHAMIKWMLANTQATLTLGVEPSPGGQKSVLYASFS